MGLFLETSYNVGRFTMVNRIKIINLLKAKRNRCAFTRDTLAYDIYTKEIEVTQRENRKH